MAKNTPEQQPGKNIILSIILTTKHQHHQQWGSEKSKLKHFPTKI